jgi:carboxylesterase
MSLEFCFNLERIANLKYDNDSLRGSGVDLTGSNGSLVILIHGLTGTPSELSFLAGSLNRKGYSVVCPRLANHGKPLQVLKNTTWQDCYQSARDALIESMTQGKRIFVAGLSMGALLALLLAQEFPEKISAISCLSPTLFYDGWNMPWIRHLLPLAYITPLKHFLYFKEEPPYGIKNEAIRAHVHSYYSQATLGDTKDVSAYGYPYFPLTLLYQLHLLVRYLTGKLNRIDIPVQLIQAKDDDMTSVKNSQFIYDRINSKIKEIVLLTDSYHVISADQERDKVAEKMEEFFRRCRDSRL